MTSRTIKDATDTYYRAMWALDSAGFNRRADAMWLKMRWNHCARIANLQSGDPGFYSAEVLRLIENAEQCIRACEKDHQRQRWEMQRDFLLGVVKRCLFAANTKVPPNVPRGFLARMFNAFKTQRPDGMSPQEVSFMATLAGKLHWYAPQSEDFHADLGVGYFLWAALRSELKEGLTLCDLHGDADHRDVKDIATRMRNIIRALEHGETDGLDHFDKSKLHLSDEQHREQLWAAVVIELQFVLHDYEQKKRLSA